MLRRFSPVPGRSASTLSVIGGGLGGRLGLEWLLVGVLFGIGLLGGGSSVQGAEDEAGIAFFEKHIRPVLVAKCYSCHAADAKEIKGGLVLDTREGIRRGGETGPAVVPGNLDDSILIEALKHDGLQMPPNERLSDDVIARFEQWIRTGAADPRDGKASVIKREIDFEKAREHWAFQPIRRPEPPSVAQKAWPANDVDRFILAKLEAAKIKPVADADAVPLARRIYFDVIGLPPSPGEVDAFVSAHAADPRAAVAALVDKLLATPQFGERWGRHWLDVVRFAESTGMERNFTYPQAWKYRDYVIASFNADKPFDQFIREQVAGDLLPADTPERRREHLVATGFLALGPKGLNEQNREQFVMDLVDEQLDTTFRAFMGLTAGCARCHDHKFDPIPSKEYYALAGIFTSTETFYGTPQVQGNRQSGRLLAMNGGEVSPVRPVAAEGRNAKPIATPKGTTEAQAQLKTQLLEAERKLAALKKQYEATGKKNKPKVEKLLKEAQREVDQLAAQVERRGAGKAPEAEASISSASTDLLMAVLEGASPADTQFRVRGEPNDRGDTIPRGLLTIGSVGHIPKIESGSGRRELAEYLTQADNPLTARVAANRVWQHLFGRGIVATVDNFGTQAEPPTHPELLDWLATELTAHEWSLKHLIRTVMTSRAYQLAAVGQRQAEQVSPTNDLVWRARHRRLEIEAIRDSLLAISGELDLSPPTEGSSVARIGEGNLTAARLTGSNTQRSVYLPIARLAVPDMLQLFDFPEPSNISGQRDVTTVATQALYLMNNAFVLDQAGKFAQRLLAQEGLGDPARVDLAYRLAFGRYPTSAERAESLEFVKSSQESMSKVEKVDPRVRSWTALCQALLASAEFRYVE